ncbi:fatty-acid--CoA ligase [Aminobacter sp. HY435]|uniref:fatty-acid--CoA ligase n=1 Tax=Aminobacter sp. HY435 TaxID=2970917 RepID=UPI0022B975A0|nr:fatty-acid--CoA ligase [Aminobacter sp. HY435]
MLGLMQEWPLLCHKIMDHAARQHPHREVVSRSIEGPIVRTTYAELRTRSLKVAQRLEREGYKSGDRIATLAWNTARHMEAWYGIMGIGAVYHTLNPRLFPEQLVWIMNHAEDQALFVDLTFMPLVEKIAPLVPSLKRIIVLSDSAHLPPSSLPNVIAFEQWLAEADGDFAWRDLDEHAAAGMCYTSGTTGDPKGVVYSHRSNVLHAMIAVMPDAMGISARDVVMPVVPMFHANAWGLAQSTPMVGAKLVMPGGRMDGASIYEMLDTERVTFTAAVPTVWLMLLQHLEETGKKLPHLNKVVIGGSACPRAVTEKFERNYGVEVIHAWGMTEMSPLGTLCTIKPEYDDLEGEARLNIQQKQGYTPFGVEMKVTDDDDNEMPWDGQTFGRLKVRGPAVSAAYYGGASADQFGAGGWFDTGDVAHIDVNGYMQITDRSKDVIKSGGEWISSIELENIAVGHPDVQEAAVIGVKHPRWDERPLLVIVRKQDKDPAKADILAFLDGKVAKWWMPDDVAFVDEIPHTATGKIQKMALRERFKDYRLPTAAST